VTILQFRPAFLQIVVISLNRSPSMSEAAGKTGRVVRVYDDGDVRVKVPI
jgi:hypothetical protein